MGIPDRARRGALAGRARVELLAGSRLRELSAVPRAVGIGPDAVVGGTQRKGPVPMDMGPDVFLGSVKVVAGTGFEPMTFRL